MLTSAFSSCITHHVFLFFSTWQKQNEIASSTMALSCLLLSNYSSDTIHISNISRFLTQWWFFSTCQRILITKLSFDSKSRQLVDSWLNFCRQISTAVKTLINMQESVSQFSVTETHELSAASHTYLPCDNLYKQNLRHQYRLDDWGQNWK